jgi:elongator complex protein 4
MVFETLHLDLEGGVSERRTTAPATGKALSGGTVQVAGGEEVAKTKQAEHGALAAVEVEMEMTEPKVPEQGVRTRKKKVAFQTDRPELYDY